MGRAPAPQWLQAGPKVSAKNMTLREELIDDAIDCRRRNGKDAATRPQDGHADDTSLCVDEGAAFGSWAEHKIHADEVVDSAAAKTVPRPSHGGDDAEAGDRTGFVISDCKDDVTRAQLCRIGGRNCGQPIGLEAQHSDVRTGVSTRERGLDEAPTGKGNLDALVLLQNFFSGDNDAGMPMDATGRPSATAVNSDDAAARALD
jgi:hypothetical protein